MSRTQQLLSTNGQAGLVEGRAGIVAVTVGVWAALLAWFLGSVAVAAGTIPLSLAAGEMAACLFGLAICLASARPLARRMDKISAWAIGALPILGATAAIIWTIFARLIAFPLARMAVHDGRTIAAPHQHTGAIAVLFVCWAALVLMLRSQRFDQAATAVDHGTLSDLWVPTVNGRRALSFDNISKVTAEREYVRIHTLSGSTHLVRSSIVRLRGQLGKAFVQVHRSTLVNARHVTGYRRSDGRVLVLSLADGSVAKVGRNYRNSAKELLEQRASGLSRR